MRLLISLFVITISVMVVMYVRAVNAVQTVPGDTLVVQAYEEVSVPTSPPLRVTASKVMKMEESEPSESLVQTVPLNLYLDVYIPPAADESWIDREARYAMFAAPVMRAVEFKPQPRPLPYRTQDFPEPGITLPLAGATLLLQRRRRRRG